MPDVMDILKTAVADADAQVRLWAVAVCAEIATPQAVEVALQVLDQPMDENLDFLLEKLCQEQADAWMPPVLAGKLKLNGNPTHQVYALRATRRVDALKPLFNSLKAGKLDDEQTALVLETAAATMDPERDAMLAGDAAAAIRFEALHLRSVRLNMAQLAAIAAALVLGLLAAAQG